MLLVEYWHEYRYLGTKLKFGRGIAQTSVGYICTNKLTHVKLLPSLVESMMHILTLQNRVTDCAVQCQSCKGPMELSDRCARHWGLAVGKRPCYSLYSKWPYAKTLLALSVLKTFKSILKSREKKTHFKALT